MIGMPTPQVDPSLSSKRTCTGFPDGVEGAADGAAAASDDPAEAAGPSCQAPPGDELPQAADRTSVTPSTAAAAADRHLRERLMTARMLRIGRTRQARS